MAWFPGTQEKLNLPDVNAEFAALKGVLSEDEAQKWVVKYFRANLGLAARFFLGVKLLEFQEIAIKAAFQRDYSLLIMSRGGSKSFTIAVFVALFAIFEQGTRIALISKTFRQSRMIMQTISDFADKPEAGIFRECLGPNGLSRKNDEWSMKIGRSVVTALPLGDGNKLRGYRFKCMIIDEFLLMSKSVVNQVLMPFLATNAEPEKRIKIKRTEDALIKQGLMGEKDRTKFKNSKMICMSSASYKFEFLYEKYCEYLDNIQNGFRIDKETGQRKPLDGTYFVWQLAYNSLPKDLYDPSVLEASRKSMTAQQFNREFNSHFTDDSSGYFSAKALMDCTCPDGSEEAVEVIGDPDAEYILSCDPSYSAQETSDFFSMVLTRILPNGKHRIVNNYAVAGGAYKDHIAYLYYLVKNFNIKLIALDNAGGGGFIQAANESKLFKDAGIEIDLISNTDIKLGKTDQSTLKEHIIEFKKLYSQNPKKIKAYCVYFESSWILAANELLQKVIDGRHIYFSCGLETNSSAYDRSLSTLESCKELDTLNFVSKDEDSVFGGSDENEDEESNVSATKNLKSRKTQAIDFIERQDELMLLTKKQIGMIEPKNTGSGISFDLPPELKKVKGAARPRRDLYSAAFILNWFVFIYNELGAINVDEEDLWKNWDGPVAF